jgi:hypothetical protein
MAQSSSADAPDWDLGPCGAAYVFDVMEAAALDRPLPPVPAPRDPGSLQPSPADVLADVNRRALGSLRSDLVLRADVALRTLYTARELVMARKLLRRPPPCRSRARVRCHGRTRRAHSRRVRSAARAGPSGDPDEGEPAEGRRHDRDLTGGAAR